MTVIRGLILVLGLSLLGPLLSTGQSPASLDARRKALNDLLAEQWEYNLRTNPIQATILGDKRYNDQLGDFSEEAVRKDLGEGINGARSWNAIGGRALHAVADAGFSDGRHTYPVAGVG